MAKDVSSNLGGIILILIGLFLLAGNVWHFDAETYWPLIFFALALFMITAFIGNPQKNAGVLVPFGIFLVIGSIFQYCALYGWDYMEWLWPGFIFAPGLGLFFLYLVKREAGLLIPVTILFGLSFIFFVGRSEYAKYWPVILILAGIVMILRHGRPRGADDSTSK